MPVKRLLQLNVLASLIIAVGSIALPQRSESLLGITTSDASMRSVVQWHRKVVER